jgi:predicted site-specific integrase-resolvase
MPKATIDTKYYRTKEVCETVGISRNTLFSWLRRGVLGDTELRDRRGWRLFTNEDIGRLGKEAGRTVAVPRRQV